MRTRCLASRSAIIGWAILQSLAPLACGSTRGGRGVATATEMPGVTTDLEESRSVIADRLLRSTVLIIGQKEPMADSSVGSGFIVSGAGTIVTNAHVVEGAGPITVHWDSSLGRAPQQARVLGRSPGKHDLVLLAIGGTGEIRRDDPLPIGTEYGLTAPVLSAGFPRASLLASPAPARSVDIVISRGVVTSIKRHPETGRVTMLQTDAEFSSGSSGGPLVDASSGKVIGINTFTIDARADGAGGDTAKFAIPAGLLLEEFPDHLGPSGSP